MNVSEIFYSLQGEGMLTGTPTVFIRLAGCPLRCRWCDTKYAWDANSGENMGVEQVAHKVQQRACRFVVITGGEPMLSGELPELAAKLAQAGKHVTIETAGIAYIPDLHCDLMSISPKLSNSVPDDPEQASVHERTRFNLAALKALTDNYDCQLKFVVDCPGDITEIQQTIDKLENIDPQKVMLMPQAKTREQLLAKSPMVAELCKQTGYVFCNRVQILLWDNRRAT